MTTLRFDENTKPDQTFVLGFWDEEERMESFIDYVERDKPTDYKWEVLEDMCCNSGLTHEDQRSLFWDSIPASIRRELIFYDIVAYKNACQDWRYEQYQDAWSELFYVPGTDEEFVGDIYRDDHGDIQYVNALWRLPPGWMERMFWAGTVRLAPCLELVPDKFLQKQKEKETNG